ncbi:MAG: ABC transporter permease [Proteobacteria bacterium]|nr:ABC transporter permease [Pseudomonadota bacterium]MBI3495905.1 ABC transporter permease [Pseudomonadota bacterium]
MTEAATAELGIDKPLGRKRGAQGILRRLLTHRLFMTGAVLFVAVALIALLAELLATHDPVEMRARNRFKPPSALNWFGTDNFGRDIFSRLVFGARLSLEIGLATVSLTALFGTLAGTVAGYFRRLDNLVMRAMDALMAFPAIMLALAIAAALGPSALNVVIALSAVYTPRTARIARASVLVVREMDFVEAARSVGASHHRILWRHILPNCLAPLIVQLTFVFAYAVIAEAVLSFLGVGPPPPAPSWGNVIAEGKDYIREAPWITLFPGLAIAMTVLGLNLLGDGLRDVLDPRMKVQQG